MMSSDPRTPVLVGVAQYVGREDDPAKGLSPADMLAEAARGAIADSGAEAASAVTAFMLASLKRLTST